MPTAIFPDALMDQKQLFNRCVELIGGANPDELLSLRVSVSGISIPPLAVELDCLNDSVQMCADNGTTIEGILSNVNNHLIVTSAPPVRTVEIDQAVAGEMSFTSAAETASYNIVFIGLARTGGSEDFLLDISVKRGTVIHPIYKRTKFKDFVSITDELKLSPSEVLIVTTTGITTSTVDLTVIKETI